MRTLFVIASFIFLLASCNSTDYSNNDSIVNVDSTEVLRQTKEKDEIFSPLELDSFFVNLKTSPLGALPKNWEMLTKKNNDLIVLIRGGGDNTRFSITESNNSFILALSGMHDAVEYLIVDCTQSGNETTIKYYTTTTWTEANRFDDVIEDRKPAYSTLVIKEAPTKPEHIKCNFPNLVICNYPAAITYYVNAEHIKDFKREEEPSPYD